MAAMQRLPAPPWVSPARLATVGYLLRTRPPDHPSGRHRSHFTDGESKAQQSLVTCQRLQLISNLSQVQSQASECHLSLYPTPSCTFSFIHLFVVGLLSSGELLGHDHPAEWGQCDSRHLGSPLSPASNLPVAVNSSASLSGRVDVWLGLAHLRGPPASHSVMRAAQREDGAGVSVSQGLRFQLFTEHNPPSD